jgi:restriction system protein
LIIKHWKTSQVGVRQVREPFGALHDQKLDRAILLCTGKFTDDAHDFAVGNITLVDSKALLPLLKIANAEFGPVFRRHFESKVKLCPGCESEMVLRIAQKPRTPAPNNGAAPAIHAATTPWKLKTSY